MIDVEEIVSFRLDEIHEFWVGADEARDSIRIAGTPTVLEDDDRRACCLAGVGVDGELFCSPLALITACIVHVGDRNRVFYFPDGIKDCRLEELIAGRK